jgi:hypothetical protein
MTDDLRPDDEIDQLASDVLDGARPDLDERPEVHRRVVQFEAVRRELRDDRDAPSTEELDHLVVAALASRDRPTPDAHPTAPVIPLAHRRARRLRGVMAAAAGVVLLAGAGWFLTRGPSGQETSEEASTGAAQDSGGDAATADSAEALPPQASTTTAPLAAGPPEAPTEGESLEAQPDEEELVDRTDGTATEEDPTVPTTGSTPLWSALLEWLPGEGEGRDGS